MSPAAHPLPTLVAPSTPGLTLRPSDPADVGPLLELLKQPAVAEWWGDNTLESITEEILGAWTIEVDDAVAGILECHEETEPMYPSVAFDIMLGTQWHRRGLGRTVLRLAIDYFITRGYHRFAIDPAVANTAAVRCYEAVGFQHVGILRQSERAPDGTFRDALMMDLLATDLT